MKTQELISAKEELQKNIEELLISFSKKTDSIVKEISIENLQTTNFIKPQKYDVKIGILTLKK